MMQGRKRRRGQTTTEYGITIGVVIAAVIAMGPRVREMITSAINTRVANYQTNAQVSTFYNPNQQQGSTSESLANQTNVDSGSISATSRARTRTRSQ